MPPGRSMAGGVCVFLTNYERLMTTLPGEPIFISSDLVRFTGGITEAILLSCFTAWAEDDGEEWFTKTTVEIQEATALSPH